MSFTSLGLSEALARALEAAGYTQPTPVQQRAIPAALQGRDLMVAAQTGTGKTGGFALPVLELLFPNGHPDREHRHAPKQPRVLVLTPTRELAAQVHDSFKLYARDLPLKSACIFGGVGMNPQVQALAKGIDVLVACPGRLLDLANQKAIDLSRVEILVLDEADRMLDMGFIHDVKKVLAKLPSKRQNLLFSATFSKDITDLAGKLLHNPERIEVTPPNTTVERIEQRMFRIGATQKRALLAHLVTVGAWEQVLVFTRTKHGANRLAEYLCKQGLPAAAIHGNKSQNARTKALADFKANAVRILVATDIAARGLDIDQLPHVVNYELPNVEEDYVHRIGRTGRAGRSGEAVSLVSPDEDKLLKAIERLTKQRIPEGDMQGFDPSQVVDAGPADSDERPPRPAHGRGRKDLPSERKERPARGERSDKPKADKPAQPARSEQSASKPRAERPPRADASSGQAGDKSRNRRGGSQQGAGRDERRSSKPAAIQLAPGELPLPTRPDRDPEAFLDDEYDNFGNSVEYVSPYQGKNQGRGGRRPAGTAGTAASAAGAARPAAAPRNNAGKPAGARQNNGGGKGRAPRDIGQRSRDSLLRELPLSEPAVRGSRDTQPVIVHKPSRSDRLPTAEQLEQLEQESRVRSEKPALLTRNK
ncbi:DEAD/DEAH box helicase [Pseudomonas sp. MAP12]|uniref:ATP-dependent RNA helicase RhlE n=1 Tax=Geopseudomonas aromaticivorans TaxID=2849492 RepID=A0ABS6MZ64_9GAMM|nr:DEAD/DEAH box helicase [Pseudomonas aromaticivorans]MBV2134086.1 DEAD/DEAH box helicase [Pseudomonas aromaticivorans]